jgi:hypothetical protein
VFDVLNNHDPDNLLVGVSTESWQQRIERAARQLEPHAA